MTASNDVNCSRRTFDVVPFPTTPAPAEVGVLVVGADTVLDQVYSRITGRHLYDNQESLALTGRS